MTKVCIKCCQELPLGDFYLDKSRGKHRPNCKTCTSAIGKAWRTTHKEQKSLKDKNYRVKNLEKIKAYSKEYYQANKPKYLESFFRRKAAKLKAMPAWLSDTQLKELEYFYRLRADANLLSDYEYEVDHIVPLQGKNVCGLHVPWNLQLLPKEINRAKSNKY